MTSPDETLSPSEELTDRVVQELEATPAGEWAGCSTGWSWHTRASGT
jgi:hypothetical protein